MKYQNIEYNDAISDFIKENHIDVERLINLSEAQTITGKKINPIAFKYGIWKKYDACLMSLSNIIGASNFDMHNNKNIVESMKNYFGDSSSGYTSRADGMLKYSKYDVVDKLQQSFQREPMYADEYEPMKYVISINGMHRYHILRIHYLNEITKPGLTEEEKKAIKEEFIIPIMSKRLDFIKTYCNFILNSINENYYISSEYDKDYNLTGKSVIQLPNSEKLIMEDKELINYTKTVLSNDNDFLINQTQKFYNDIISFKIFIDSLFPELKKENSSGERRMKNGI